MGDMEERGAISWLALIHASFYDMAPADFHATREPIYVCNRGKKRKKKKECQLGFTCVTGWLSHSEYLSHFGLEAYSVCTQFLRESLVRSGKVFPAPVRCVFAPLLMKNPPPNVASSVSDA